MAPIDPSAKASIRAVSRAILAGISPQAREAASVEICRRVAGLPEWSAARCVGLYAALPAEPDMETLLRAPGKSFCFPRVAGDGLEFHACESVEALRAGRWQLMEPDPEQCPMVRADEIDLLLIPGLAFTSAGARLGRGGGYYDRFLAGVHPRARKIGVCFHAQLVPALPREGHDLDMDLVVTERSLR